MCIYVHLTERHNSLPLYTIDMMYDNDNEFFSICITVPYRRQVMPPGQVVFENGKNVTC